MSVMYCRPAHILKLDNAFLLSPASFSRQGFLNEVAYKVQPLCVDTVKTAANYAKPPPHA